MRARVRVRAGVEVKVGVEVGVRGRHRPPHARTLYITPHPVAPLLTPNRSRSVSAYNTWVGVAVIDPHLQDLVPSLTLMVP